MYLEYILLGISSCLLFIMLTHFKRGRKIINSKSGYKLEINQGNTHLSCKSPFNLPPGPVGVPLFGFLPFLGSIPALKITKLSKKFGDIFSVYFGTQLVVFINDVETMKEIGKVDVFLGRHQLDIVKGIRENCGLIFLEKRGWAEWRRFTLKSLRDMGLARISMEELIHEQVQDFIQFLDRGNRGQGMYLKEPLEVAGLNALWIILAGEKYDIEDEHKRNVLKTISEGISDQNVLGMVTFLPWLCKLFPNLTGYNKTLKCLGSPIDFAEEIMDRHRRLHSPGSEKDFIDFALTKIYSTTDSASSFYKEVGMKNLLFTVLDLLFTGSDSISSTVGWAIICVAAYPEVQRKIHEEIDALGLGRYNDEEFNSDLESKSAYRGPSLKDKSKLIYTQATMMEVMRKSSMLPFGAMHSALEDAEFHGHFIPKRTVILMNLYGVHHDPEYWDDPDIFRPERFIDAEGNLRKEEHLIPFFTGKRSCPGETLAVNEFFLFFTGLLHKFRVELEDQEAGVNLGPRPGFVIRPPDCKVVLINRF